MLIMHLMGVATSLSAYLGRKIKLAQRHIFPLPKDGICKSLECRNNVYDKSVYLPGALHHAR